MEGQQMGVLVWSLVISCQLIAIVMATDNTGERETVEKRARIMFGKREGGFEVNGKDADSEESDDEKRSFGWGTYKWDPLHTADDIALDADMPEKRPFGGLFNLGRPRRRFLFGKRGGNDDDLYETGDVKRAFGRVFKRPRTFSFGRRSDESDKRTYGPWKIQQLKRNNEGTEPFMNEIYSSEGAAGRPIDGAAGVDEMDKRGGRVVLFGKRPFGGRSHVWGSSSFGSEDNNDVPYLKEEKRPDSSSQGKRVFKFGKRVAD